MLSLVFECLPDPALSVRELEALQRTVWKRCASRGLGGFLVRGHGRLLGCFEGEERAVLATVEAMIRKPGIRSVRVVEEVHKATASPGLWSCNVYTVADLRRIGAPGAPELAQMFAFPVEPRVGTDLQRDM